MKIFKLFAIGFLALTLNFDSVAQNEKIKTAFLYQFSRYIQWPGNNGSFTYGVYGDGPIYNALVNMAKTRPGFKIIKVTSLAQAKQCNILFVTDKVDNIQQVKQSVGNSPTLIVTEKSGFAKKGSEINFTNVGGKLRFEMNSDSLKKKDY
ncbi:YfiR family protein [Mangrovivirga cuniculi]|uniref:YfiR family protein n=1 Tax=Mangrovivirga cuniculi TaxID=2715131 RepID=A0A4D7JGP2_9BACT|nr:YfiR family protein [Mangrovivirga cuniculi]QCK14263.1 hypothetical protein DCC35_05645 [Mangrovivirga cuniculi]